MNLEYIATSPQNEYLLKHKGEEVHRGSGEDMFTYIHSHEDYSVSQALETGAYEILPFVGCCLPPIHDQDQT